MHRIAALIHAGETATASAELRDLVERHGGYERAGAAIDVSRRQVIRWASDLGLTGKLQPPGNPNLKGDGKRHSRAKRVTKNVTHKR